MHQAFTPFTIRHIAATQQDSPVYQLSLEPQSSFPQWRAGQFIMLSCEDTPTKACARPFSIASLTNDTVDLFIHIRGNTTKKLISYRPGDTLYAWGPLGTYFSPPDKRTLIIAGGIGIAPFVTYIHQYSHIETHLLFGHRLPLSYYPFSACSKENVYLQSMQDTSSKNLQVFLETVEEAMLVPNTRIVACGPLPLLRFVQKIALQHTVEAELSLENTMYCGIGLCLGCVVETTKTAREELHCGAYVPTCTQGPVFSAEHITL